MKIVVLERDSVGTDIDVSGFEQYGEVTFYRNSVAEDTADKIKDADIVIANKAPLNEETLKAAPNVKLISEFATGYNNVDLEYCNKRGITVCNVVNYSTAMVAQHTFAMTFYLLEKMAHYDNYVKSGAYGLQDRFSNFDIPFTELDGKTWGIIGLGNIGRKVAEIARAFGCRVISYSVSGNNTADCAEHVDFDTLLRESDFLSLHCPLTDKTENIIDEAALRKMKATALLLNVARGPVVNQEALYKALTEEWIAGAGLDVLTKEPIAVDNPLNTIKDSGKLIITPHLAWASVEARTRCVKENYKNIEAFLAGTPRNVVNNPN